MSDSLQPHELQHARPPCPSPTPGVHPDSHPMSQWCPPAISSSVAPFSSCPQSLPASESFPISQLFTWSGQSTGVSASASFLPKKSQGWSPSEWTGWISLCYTSTNFNKEVFIPKETVVQMGKLDWKWEGTLIITHKSEGHWVLIYTLYPGAVESSGEVGEQSVYLSEGTYPRIWKERENLRHGEKAWGLQGQIHHSGVEMWMASIVLMQMTVVSSDEVRYEKGIE